MRPRQLISRRTRTAVEDVIRRARAGEADYLWAHRAILRAGYASVTQAGDEPVLVTVDQIVRVTSAAHRTVRRWIRDGLPCYRPATGNQPSLYDLCAVWRWRLKEEAKREALTPGTADKEFWLAQLRREQTIRARRENRLRRGDLVERAAIEEAWALIGRTLRGRVEQVAAVYGQEAARLIAEALDEVDTAVEASMASVEPAEEEDRSSDDDEDRPEEDPPAPPPKRTKRRRPASRGKKPRSRVRAD